MAGAGTSNNLTTSGPSNLQQSAAEALPTIRMQRDGGGFLVGGTAGCVAVLVIAHREWDYTDELLDRFYKKMVQAAKDYGMSLPEKFEYCHKTSNPAEIRGIYSDWQNGKHARPDFVISVLPSRKAVQLQGEPSVNSKQIHNLTKFLEFTTGIPTQNYMIWTMKHHIVESKDCICIKKMCAMNLKLGGVNWEEAIPDDDRCSRWLGKPGGVLFCGLATYCSGREKRVVVGLAANTRQSMFDYCMQHWWYVSPTSENKVKGLEAHIAEMCKLYYANHKMLPTSIILFRRLYQFANVFETEGALVRKGLQDGANTLNLGMHYEPKLTLIVATKVKEHTRFQGTPSNRGFGSDIAPPTYFHFYIKALDGPQETEQTFKYTVVLDENEVSHDELQSVCQKLCNGYQTNRTATSVPAPLTCAQKATERGNAVLDGYLETAGAHKRN